MKLELSFDRWPMRRPFVTSQGGLNAIETLTVRLDRGGARGWGEALGVDYRGEDARTMGEQIEQVRRQIERLADRTGLARLLPPGGARNALDCALWDLEVKATSMSIWQRLGLEPRALTTAYTLSLAASEAMAAEAATQRQYPILKLKLDADSPIARLAAVRAARPEAVLLVDANGGWTAAGLSTCCGRSPRGWRISAWRWSSSPCRGAPTTNWRAGRAPYPSAPTSPARPVAISTTSPRAMAWSTSSWTRPVG
jgi:L-alanine-DL-glutamate epimerase-like enolase superfamily enzyme